MSFSKKLNKEAIHILKKPKKKIKKLFSKLYFSKKKYIKKQPETIRVLLCTKDLTGVGASIAFVNHPIKGNCALFVKVLKNKNISK